MKTLLLLCTAFFIVPLNGYSQANDAGKPIPAAPASVTSPNSDPSVMDGLWKVTWKDEVWPYGSIFQLQSGSIGGGAHKITLVAGQPVLQGPNLNEGIPLKIAGDGTWTGMLGSKVFTLTPYASNVFSSITTASLNGEWTCSIYGQNSTPLNLSNGKATGWGEGSGSVVLDSQRCVTTFPNGAQFWLYYVNENEWLGFGKFPTDQLPFRPVIWQRSGKP